MGQRYCENGLLLDTKYIEKTSIWVSAEADKRIAIGVMRGVGNNEWNEIARRANDAKLDHESALEEFIEHVFACPVCNARVLALPNEHQAQHLH
jgi:hypothetical protein